MTVYRDTTFYAEPSAGRRRGQTTACSHLFSDVLGAEGTAELVATAKRCGLLERWIQHPGTYREHFDLIGDTAIARADVARVLVMDRRGFGQVLNRKRAGSPQLDLVSQPSAPDVEPVERRTQPPTWLGVATAGQTRSAMLGFHPTGRALHPSADLKCADCAHKVRSNARFVKCTLDKLKWTAGPGSDIRAKWRACVDFLPPDEEAAP